nr:trichodiene oxygenase [Quercus suber]
MVQRSIFTCNDILVRGLFRLFPQGRWTISLQIERLHRKYGPIIRPVPGEVHVNDPKFLEKIYAVRIRNQVINKGLNVDQSVAGAADFKSHRNRRDALNPYFSQKAVTNLEWLMAEKRDKVIRIFDNGSKTRSPLNLSDIYFGYANDLVRSFSFGSDSDLLGDLSEAKEQRNNLARLLTTIHVQRHFTAFFRVMGQLLPCSSGSFGLLAGGTYKLSLSWSTKSLTGTVMDLVRFKQRARQDIDAVLADTDNEKKGRHSVFYELRDSPILPLEEKTSSRLQDEATLIVMAGTESTAKSLGIASFYLFSQPQIMEKLRQEIANARQSSQELTLPTLLALPYLNTVIQEANRLSFGVTNRSVHYSPDETLTYTASYGLHKGTTYMLPPKTVMSTLTYCTHTNELLFQDPWRFDPDRWIVNPELPGNNEEAVNRRKRYIHALGKGHRKCIGIHVANAALCLMLAELINYDMALFETDEDDIKFQYDFQISHPKLDSLGIRAVVLSKVQGYDIAA